ncbi:MAG: hypothetical protein LBD41_04460 [Clostridiales Family XIII bacterium]|nr:hypothetical protein [Clostridiales Family XIII bacterium]
MGKTGGIINFNKPQDMTSQDAVIFIKKVSGYKKVGHAGTLDPMATGVLPIYLGRYTKLINIIYDNTSIKTYRAKMRFGLFTDTQDIWGKNIPIIDDYNKIEKEKYHPIPSQEEIKKNLEFLSKEKMANAIKKFKNKIKQFMPAYSAIRFEGKRLYELARENKEIPIIEREVYIKSIDILDFDIKKKEAEIRCTCGRGTYIRTIINNIGKELRTGAVMISLIRESDKGLDVSDSVDFNTVLQYWNENRNINKYIKDISCIDYDITEIDIKKYLGEKFILGNKVPNTYIGNKDKIFVYNGSQFLGVGKIENGELIPCRVIADKI